MTTRRTLTETKDRPELDRLLRDAAAKFDAMSSDEKKAMFAAQRKSWVVGEMMLEHPEMTRDEAAAIYDSVSI